MGENEPSSTNLKHFCQAVSRNDEPRPHPSTIRCSRCGRWFCDTHAEHEGGIHARCRPERKAARRRKSMDSIGFAKRRSIKMTGHSAAQRIVAGTPVRLVSADVMKGRINEIHSLVASRAYELFEKRSRASGQDINDWLHAEHELIHSCCHEMKESADAFFFHATMPGSFTSDQLQISIEPRRLILYGETEVSVTSMDGKTIYKRLCPRRIFRIQDLPVEVEPSRATATLKGDFLEVMMPKAAKTGTNTS